MLTIKKVGRPLLLGSDLDNKVQECIHTLHAAGGVVNHHVCIATVWGILQGHNHMLLAEYGGHIQLTRGWALSLMERMNYVKEEALQSAK